MNTNQQVKEVFPLGSEKRNEAKKLWEALGKYCTWNQFLDIQTEINNNPSKSIKETINLKSKS